MSILRVAERKQPYVVLDKGFIDSPTLSWRAKGILAYLLARPDNWEIREYDLVAHATEGRDAVRKALKELKAHGYIVKSQRRSDVGQFSVVEYDIHERPNSVAYSHYILVSDLPPPDFQATDGSKAHQRFKKYDGPFNDTVGVNIGEYDKRGKRTTASS